MSRAVGRHSHISITQSTPDGVIHTDVHITEVDISHANGTDEACFHPELVCDPEERALIEELRAYLRPTTAPNQLITRLEETLDRCCRDHQDGVDGDDQSSLRDLGEA